MRAAIYVRQSQDKTGEALAVGRQLAECRELVERNGWTVSDIYEDNDSSATTGKVRRSWVRLLADLEAGHHDVLVCWHTDRMYRRLRDLADLVEIAERRALLISSVKASDIDLSTPAGRMLAGMLGSAARYEVEQKGARQVAANRARAKAGVVLWTRRPFGFDRDGADVRIVASEALEVRRAAQQVLSGRSLASIALDFNARGVKTSVGGEWNVTGVKRVLLNPRTAGRVAYRGEDMGGSAVSILDADTADRLSSILRDPRRTNAPSTSVKYLLSGLALCGREGCDNRPMFATSNAQGVLVYRCRTCYGTRNLRLVDEVVVGAVIARLTRPDAAGLLDPDVDVAGLRQRVVAARERRDGLAALLADGLLGADAVRLQARRLTEQIDILERDIDAGMGSSPLTVLLDATDVSGAFLDLSILARREILKTLLDVRVLPSGKGVRFDPAQVELQWKELSRGPSSR